MKVLIIEDSADFRNKLKGMLEEDYEIDTAIDGLEGLQKIKDQRYDLIITDLNMPNLDGLSMLKKVKELDLGYECPPIMMCTTEFDPSLKKEGKSAGVSFWLVKPISENKFIKVVDSLLES
jgi:two-component system chemotaxis response regulator CheY